jgi:hypothetical protein
MTNMVPAQRVIDILTAQRYFILALQHLELNPMQMRSLVDIYKENEKMALLLGVDVPDMGKLKKQCEDTIELQRLYALSDGPNEDNSVRTITSDNTQEFMQKQSSQAA